MIRFSIKRKIIGIAVVLIVLMAITALVSTALVLQVGNRLEDLTQSYVPAYGALARADIRSLQRALALRRMVIDKIQSPTDDGRLAAARNSFDASGAEFDKETEAVRNLFDGLIAKGSTFGDATALVRLETRLADLITGTRSQLNNEIGRLLHLLDGRDQKAIADSLERIDALRDELDRGLDTIRADMLDLLRADSAATARKQYVVIVTAILLTALAATLGLVFSILVSTGMTRPVRQLLEGARAVEAGRLDQTLAVTSHDEIGYLTMAFNRMVEQLRLKERIRETFGKYVDPRIVEGLISGPALATAGERRVMTVLFCDVRGFVGVSEEMTPQGLVKIMNRYFSTMSAPIREHGGIIDKYVCRRCHHGLLGTAIHGRCRSGALRRLCRARHARSRRAVSRRIARAARIEDRADLVRHPRRHCHRRGAGWQRRFRSDDELYGDGRDGKFGVASGRRQQTVQ
jgi:class 3 adenylate cyclase